MTDWPPIPSITKQQRGFKGNKGHVQLKLKLTQYTESELISGVKLIAFSHNEAAN